MLDPTKKETERTCQIIFVFFSTLHHDDSHDDDGDGDNAEDDHKDVKDDDDDDESDQIPQSSPSMPSTAHYIEIRSVPQQREVKMKLQTLPKVLQTQASTPLTGFAYSAYFAFPAYFAAYSESFAYFANFVYSPHFAYFAYDRTWVQ